ncbi:Oxysterol-binding protein-related protein 1 [Myotis brandtii]|uniref:Oxysterol-binding protein n=1 Tax=Myotis brandtii TaxID=109478 RepID=S7N950_MYOBR|nr:Oxysterol-binding protein-related protein 1 [Myotis brandtii]
MSTEAEQQLLHHARNGHAEEVRKLLETVEKNEAVADINCKGRSKSNLGWAPLHLACYFGHRQVVQALLKAGAEVNVLNDMGDTPLHRAAFTGRKLNSPNPPDVNCVDQLGNTPLHCAAYRARGPCVLALLKSGADPSLRNRNDQKPLHLAQGAEVKHLLSGNTVKPGDSCLFSVKCFDDSVHGFKVPQNSPPQAREDWLQAIEEHAAYSTHYCSQDQVPDEEEEEEAGSAGDLQESLEKAQACRQRLDRELAGFLQMVKECEVAEEMLPSFLQKVDVVSEASRETCAALSDCLTLLAKQEGARNFKLEQEQEKTKILSEALEALATEHHELEQSLVAGSPPSVLSEDEFYDALSDSESERSLSRLEAVTSCSREEEGQRPIPGKHRMSEGQDCGGGDALSNGIKKHRTSLPSPMFSRNDFSIWSILRKCIGMELSKITMPVIFNEPLSFLQRLTEYMEHTYLIQKASSLSDPAERMQCVAAFAVSAVASQWERTGKPFNPLLGETYELVRDDLGFRLISEQVSHHPPISAFHAEGLNNDFVFHGSIYPKLKFWGKSVEAEPKGTITLELLEHNEAYTWTNPTCCVHNIIVGKLWIEQYGNMEITNHKTGDKCVLNFKPCGLFGKELHKVEGYIQDKSKKKLCALYGKWTECLYSVDPATFDAFKKNDKKNTEEKKHSKQVSASEESDEMPMPDSESVCVIPGSVLLWRIAPRPPNSAQMYNFTSFAMVLNEIDKDMESVIPKTDCRLRPDIRAMENGEIDLASEEKKRLEEKQRAARKNRSRSEEDWRTRWFHQGPNPHNGAQDWLYSGSYWDRNYSNLPDIY